MKNKIEACRYLQNNGRGKLERISYEPDLRTRYVDYLLERYSVPKDVSYDFINSRILLGEGESVSDAMLYFLLDAAKETTKSQLDLSDYYSDDEIVEYSKYRYETKGEITFPLVLSCMEIVPGKQWIGALPLDVLTLFREKQIIRYNPQTQRAMTRVHKGTETTYKITVNKNAVKSIRSLMHSGLYISDTITLNIPESSEADWYYNEEKKELVFNSLDKLDIIDGFHRYLAITQESFENPDFNIVMEVRFTNFSTDEAKQFIWQSDQKTHMKKSVVASYATNKDANIIVARINQSSLFILQGDIQENGGKIKTSEICSCIDAFCLNASQQLTNQQRLLIQNDIIQRLNYVLTTCPELVERKTEISFGELAVIFWAVTKYNPLDRSTQEKCEVVLREKLLKVNQIRKTNLSRRIISKPLIRDIEAL